MGTLLSPDLGLAIWTILSFLILVGLLRAVAWKPLLGAIEARETRLREERERAEAARAEAEAIQNRLEERLARADAEAAERIAKAGKEGEALRQSLKADAEREARALMDKTKAQLAEEQRRLIGELRREVASLSILAAERLVRKSVDAGVQKTVLADFFQELEGSGKKN